MTDSTQTSHRGERSTSSRLHTSKVLVVGRKGVGKTVLRKKLAAEYNVEEYSEDDQNCSCTAVSYTDQNYTGVRVSLALHEISEENPFEGLARALAPTLAEVQNDNEGDDDNNNQLLVRELPSDENISALIWIVRSHIYSGEPKVFCEVVCAQLARMVLEGTLEIRKTAVGQSTARKGKNKQKGTDEVVSTSHSSASPSLPLDIRIRKSDTTPDDVLRGLTSALESTFTKMFTLRIKETRNAMINLLSIPSLMGKPVLLILNKAMEDREFFEAEKILEKICKMMPRRFPGALAMTPTPSPSSSSPSISSEQNEADYPAERTDRDHPLTYKSFLPSLDLPSTISALCQACKNIVCQKDELVGPALLNMSQVCDFADWSSLMDRMFLRFQDTFQALNSDPIESDNSKTSGAALLGLCRPSGGSGGGGSFFFTEMVLGDEQRSSRLAQNNKGAIGLERVISGKVKSLQEVRSEQNQSDLRKMLEGIKASDKISDPDVTKYLSSGLFSEAKILGLLVALTHCKLETEIEIPTSPTPRYFNRYAVGQEGKERYGQW